jgi:hypothetical protein
MTSDSQVSELTSAQLALRGLRRTLSNPRSPCAIRLEVGVPHADSVADAEVRQRPARFVAS